MDFMNLLRSAELLLYEVVSWLVFFPLTLWRCITRPLDMMLYAEDELTQTPDEQFADLLSPPIFLFLTLLLAHFLQTSVVQTDVAFEGVLADERNLLTLRALAFSLFPLLLGLRHVKLAAQPLTRKTLRPMFYAQCYVTVPFVFAVDLALLCGKLPFDGAGTLGTAIFGAGLVWYVRAVTLGFTVHREVPRRTALTQSLLAILVGGLSLFGIGILFILTETVKTAP